MKKIFATLILAGFLSVLMVPMVILAADVVTPDVVTEIPGACELRHSIAMKDTVLAKGAIVGEAGGKTLDGKATGIARSDWGLVCIIDKVYTVIDWVFWALLAIAGLIVLLGAFNIALAQGDAAKIGKGKALITAAIVALIIALFAKFIPSIVIAIFA